MTRAPVKPRGVNLGHDQQKWESLFTCSATLGFVAGDLAGCYLYAALMPFSVFIR
jgi:hypothetical protein